MVGCSHLLRELDSLRAQTGGSAPQRPAVLALLREALGQGRQALRSRFETGAGGLETVRGHAHLADQLVRVIYDHAAEDLYPSANPSSGERLAVLALGGYGRGELAPFSDLDLLFLCPYKRTPRIEQMVEAILYFLWDLGFKVGHATRSIDESLRLARRDQTVATNLLDARFLCGEQSLYREFSARFLEEVKREASRRFIKDKLRERDLRHAKTGESRYSLEPHIKKGKGGLRDLQTLLWITKFAYGVKTFRGLRERGLANEREVKTFEKAEYFLWTLRCHLHYLAGRGEECLTFDLQHRIAPRMGYRPHAGTKAVERLMKHYFLVAKDVGSLTRLICAALEEKSNRRLPTTLRQRFDCFTMKSGCLAVGERALFKRDPIQMLQLFWVAQKQDLEIHPETLRWVTVNLRLIDGLRENPDANKLFLEMLCHAERAEDALRTMNEAGVLGRFLPDFGRIVSMMQFNIYHHFTVDEHLIQAVGTLCRIERGLLAEDVPVATKVVKEVISRRVLYLAVLLHDIAKGRREDHSKAGAKIALHVGPRLGLANEEVESVAWLIENHLKMSDTAFKRDLGDPKTIQDFADMVQSMERLRLLLVLTVADIRAVGPGVWTAWKASLLRELYRRTEEVLSGGHVTEGRELHIQKVKDDLREALSTWPAQEIEAHIERFYPSYWLSFDHDSMLRQAAMIREATTQEAPLTITHRIDKYREVTELTLYTADHPGLFSRVAGALATAGAQIDAAKVFTLANGMALDTFYLRDRQTGEAFIRPPRLARLVAYIEEALKGAMRPWPDLDRQKDRWPSRFAVFTVPARILFDNRASDSHTVIEVNGRDHPGLLYDLTYVLTQNGLIIRSAVVTTFGEQVVDTFYVQSALNHKITDCHKLAQVKKHLIAAIEQTGPDDGKAKAKTKRAA
ncbi:MAG: [protein-PII] uridylyltransferase [Rhodospirillales bacterium]|nr:[protein-PII] uridylyltransferase [Rhodospirillales bacterium]